VLKGLGNLATLMKQAQEMGGKLQGLGDELKNQRAVGTAGGGMVEVEVNGASEVLGCKIDPSLMPEGDRELVEDLVAAAVNQALAKARQLNADAMKSLAGGVDLAGMEEMMSKFTGGPPPTGPGS